MRTDDNALHNTIAAVEAKQIQGCVFYANFQFINLLNYVASNLYIGVDC